MTRKDLIYKCAEAILEAMNEEFCETSSGEFARATATVDTPAGCIEIYTDSNNEAEVIVYHNGEERESPRLEAAIKDAIPDGTRAASSGSMTTPTRTSGQVTASATRPTTTDGDTPTGNNIQGARLHADEQL